MSVKKNKKQIEAFNFIRKNRLLPQREWEIYYHIYKLGPCTSTQISLYYKSMSRNHICSRIIELQMRGLVKHVGVERSIVSGRLISIWDTTERMIPGNTEKTKKKKKFWINVYKNKMEAYSSKDKALKNAKNNLIEMICVIKQEKQ